MVFNVSEISKGAYGFSVVGVSYAGKPKDSTAMYITKKVERLLENLRGKKQCLVFTENTIAVPDELKADNCFVLTSTPQKDYAEFVNAWAEEIEKANAKRKYSISPEGAYIGENVVIGKNSVLEPGCYIGHDVVIGDNARIRAGAVIKNSIIGDGFIAGENCTVGTTGFTMADDENGNKMRIPTLGDVVIGNNVEVGALTNVSRGSAGSTSLDDCVKLDSLVHIGHDVHLHKNVEIPAGAIIGGFADIGESAYVGINAVVRNRITIGERAFIGMGAVVTKSVEPDTTVVGNPAKKLERK